VRGRFYSLAEGLNFVNRKRGRTSFGGSTASMRAGFGLLLWPEVTNPL